MVLTVAQRRVMRHTQESNYINTLNVADQIKIHFVWFPGPQRVADALIDPLIVAPDAARNERKVEYLWQSTGLPEVRRTMNEGTITVPLRPGGKGTLTVFDTKWELTRAAIGVTLDAKTTMRGVQQRLDRLGYHLRQPGQASPGLDGTEGHSTEAALISFQADYRPGVAGGSPGRLLIRGEWNNNPEITFLVDSNQSAVDAPFTQNSLDVMARP